MKKKKKIGDIWLAVIIIASIVFGFSISYTIGSDMIDDFIFGDDSFTPSTIPISEKEVLENCGNLDVEDTAHCLRDNVKTFKFEETNEGHTDFDTIKEIGGDCYNYAMMYLGMAKSLGFDAEIRRYDMEESVFDGHRFVFLWDDENYCRIDVLEVKCWDRVNNEK